MTTAATSLGARAAPRRLRIAARQLERVAAWCRGAWPEEGCGLLFGHRGADFEVREVTRGANCLPAARRLAHFALDPLHLMRAERRARARGHELLGVWHSHARGEARPSREDRRASWPDHAYLILSLRANEPTRARAFEGPQAEPLELLVAPRRASLAAVNAPRAGPSRRA